MKNLAVGVMSSLATIGGLKAQSQETVQPLETAVDTTEIPADIVEDADNDSTISFEEATTRFEPEQPLIGGIGGSIGAGFGASTDFLMSAHASGAWQLAKAKASLTAGIGEDGFNIPQFDLMFDLFLGASLSKADGLYSATGGIGFGRGFPYIGAGGTWGAEASGFRLEYRQSVAGEVHGDNRLHLDFKASADVLKNKLKEAGEDDWAVLLRPAMEIDYALNDGVSIFGRAQTGFSIGDIGVKPTTSFEVGARIPLFANPLDLSGMFNL